MKYDNAEEKHNKWRRLIRENFSHKTDGKTNRDGLMAFELWGGLPSAEMKKRIGELKKHGIRFEEIWIDAGWYGNCTNCTDTFSGDWGVKTGDWFVNENVHPGKLSEYGDTAYPLIHYKNVVYMPVLWQSGMEALGIDYSYFRDDNIGDNQIGCMIFKTK